VAGGGRCDGHVRDPSRQHPHVDATGGRPPQGPQGFATGVECLLLPPRGSRVS
jgi:hypothetical protein